MKLRHLIATSLLAVSGILLFSSHVHANSSHNYTYKTRKQWGANEDLRIFKEDNPAPQLIIFSPDFYIRYADELKLKKVITHNKNGEKLTWPLQYPEQVSKIFIHHTGSQANLDNPEQIVRDIYHSHTITRGWGDIGYNYLIGPEGTVYEGRYGGDNVVGAHVGPMGNRGSIGIALLGNYDTNPVPEKARQALIQLLAEKTRKFDIDPEGKRHFRGETIPNITGHESVMNTTCPGKHLSALLPSIRKAVARINSQHTTAQEKKGTIEKQYAYEYIPVLKEINIPADRKMEYVVKLKNLGTEPWNNTTRLSLISDPVVKRSLMVKTARMNESLVRPGETGTFTIAITSKLYAGYNTMHMRPHFNGAHASEDAFSIPVIVQEPHFNYEVMAFDVPRKTLEIGESFNAIVALKNTGDVTWRNYGIHRISLGSTNPQDRTSSFTGTTRLGFLKEPLVRPGNIGHFVFNLQAPALAGSYVEYFAPVVESVTWLDGKNMKFSLNVT
ncbi:hypothetical protein GF369_04055 [Candidatus Peregrinibacteria bacterium]|nr:hypothetical protein [Candidatus Peregrinibacteria bacterium]